MITLRPARPFDALAVASILGEFVDTTPWMPRVHTPADDLAHANTLIERGWVTVAERDGQTLGFAACDGEALNALYVTASCRGLGIGRNILEYMQKKSKRLVLWTFQINEGAQRFYSRHGFEEVRRTDGADNDEGLPDIQFEWRKEAIV